MELKFVLIYFGWRYQKIVPVKIIVFPKKQIHWLLSFEKLLF